MDSYLMMLYVTLEQESALKNFFVDQGWKFCKPDLTVTTDKLGPSTGKDQTVNQSSNTGNSPTLIGKRKAALKQNAPVVKMAKIIPSELVSAVNKEHTVVPVQSDMKVVDGFKETELLDIGVMQRDSSLPSNEVDLEVETFNVNYNPEDVEEDEDTDVDYNFEDSKEETDIKTDENEIGNFVTVTKLESEDGNAEEQVIAEAATELKEPKVYVVQLSSQMEQIIHIDARDKASPVRRATSGGKRYCVLCKKYEGQILDNGMKVKLHRIPGGKSKSEVTRRKLWLRGLKLHRPNLPVSDNTRVCMLHFDAPYIRGESVPKYYNLEKATSKPKSRRPLTDQLEGDISQPYSGEDEEEEIYYASKLEEEIPATYYDSIYSCENEVEIFQEEPSYRVEESEQETKQHVDHCYNLNPKPTRTVEAETQTSPCSLKPEDISHNDEKTRFYTGFPNYVTFMLFFETFLKHGADKLTYWEGQRRSVSEKHYNQSHISKPGRKRKLRPLDEFFMVCIRLRLGLLQEHLSDIFGVSVMTVSRVMNTWINFMYDHMQCLIPWPTKEQILANLPRCFHEMPDTRIVIDATEFFCEKPGSLKAQNLTWSDYKHHNTFKVLVGVAPNGLVTFISRVWGGHTGQTYCSRRWTYVHPQIGAWRCNHGRQGLHSSRFTSFVCRFKYAAIHLKVTTDDQLAVFKTQQIASSRIVVEMKMEQIKNFRLLQTVLPLSEAHLAEQMIVICTAMTNLYEPLLK